MRPSLTRIGDLRLAGRLRDEAVIEGIRGPRAKRIAIAALDAKANPATMTVQVELGGRRYVEDRDTASVLSGSKSEAAVFTERWTLVLDGPEAQPWRIVAVAPGAVVARS